MFAKDARVRIVQQVLWLLLFIQVGIVALLACVPPVSRDALSHHLYVPKLWLQRGGIVEIPFVEFAYYPMNVDLLYLVPLYFGNDILPKLIHFSFALLTAWLIYRHLRDRLHRVAGLIGSLLFLSIPVVVKLATTVYVDLGLIFFTFASMLLLLRWVEDHFALKHLLGAALLCGLALGTKYNALIVFFLLSMLVPWLYLQLRSDAKPPISQRASQANAVWYAALFVLICVLVFSPWMVKNYQWTGNPIYPLYNQIFVPTEEQSNGQGGNASGTKSVVETDRQGGLRNFSKRKFVYGEPWWETLSIPVRVFFQGQDDNPRYFDGRLTPLLFILPFFAFLRLRTDPKPLQLEKQMWLIFSVLYLIYTFFKIDMRVRYLAPIIPGLVILSVYGIYNLWAYTSSWGKSLLTNMLRWLVAIGLVVVI